MSERFFIDCYGIIDRWNRPNGDCNDVMTWAELCDTLNELDKIADDKLDNYEYTTKLEKENLRLKNQIYGIRGLIEVMENYIEDIKTISDFNE